MFPNVAGNYIRNIQLTTVFIYAVGNLLIQFHKLLANYCFLNIKEIFLTAF